MLLSLVTWRMVKQSALANTDKRIPNNWCEQQLIWMSDSWSSSEMKARTWCDMTKKCDRICEKGLPHTSRYKFAWKTITWLSRHMMLKLSPAFSNYPSTYVGASCRTNFESGALTNLTLWTVKVGKLDVCRRPLFTNYQLNLSIIVDLQSDTVW